jgi:Uma2 family endonuclease
MLGEWIDEDHRMKLRTPAKLETFADLLEQLGDIPLHRIRLRPPPGMATERDVVKIHVREDRLCELIDGVLVEKTVGARESLLALYLGHLLWTYVEQHDLGLILGADGTLRLMPGLVRIPDISFISWERLPTRELPARAIPDLVPDLAVEVLSRGNTRREMARKLREYFAVGVRLVWYVQPRSRSVTVYTAPNQSVRLTENQTLEGGTVLPGFSLPLRRLFAKTGRRRGNG